MQLREQLRLRDQEMTAAIAETPTDPSNTPEADSSTPEVAPTASEAESSADSQDDESTKSF
ncbi:hypothetical protein [Escherichia coli]|uniref:hypothetical protein n=1 Tax=Escherichia coli TaxID=562 RepID=UPI0032DA5DE3